MYLCSRFILKGDLTSGFRTSIAWSSEESLEHLNVQFLENGPTIKEI